MKIIMSILLVYLLPVLVSAPKGVNFEHKQINKELSSVLNLEKDEFSLTLLNIPVSADKPDEGRFYSISGDSSLLSYLYVGRVYTCPIGGCDNAKAENTGGSYEYFDYMVIFKPSFSVSKVSVFNYQASHGHQICSKGWLRQFIGYSGEDTLKVGKNIDSISGATKSTNTITTDIMKSRKILSEYYSEG